jgi:endonuclease YncB( thermonuclease family)
MTNLTPNPVSPPTTGAFPSFSGTTDGAGRPKRKARFITPALALVAVLGVGIFGGVLIGQNTASASSAGSAALGQGRPDGAAGGATGDTPVGMGGFTSGTVTAVDGDTVTLELTDGSTVTITTTDDTTVTTTQNSSVADLAEGDSLTVVGEADDDGNVAATSIAEGARGFGGGAGGGTPPTGTGTGTDSN